MTSAHILYIPLILFLGVVVGFVLGRTAVAREGAAAERRREEREERVRRLKEELREKGQKPKGEA